MVIAVFQRHTWYICQGGELYIEYVKTNLYNGDKGDILQIPKKCDDSDYELSDLTKEKRVVVITHPETVLFCLGDYMDNVPLWVTVMSCNRTRRLFIVHILISMVRGYTNCNTIIKATVQTDNTILYILGHIIHPLLNLSV